MTEPSRSHRTARSSRAVATLQGLQHLLFTVLYAVGLALAVLRRAQEPGWVLPVAGVLLACYAIGVGIARRASRDALAGAGWIVAMVALWAPLAAGSPAYRYLVFPLSLLALHVLGARAGSAVVAAMTAFLCWVGLSQHPDDAVPQLIGPLLSALLATGTALGYRAVLAESRERGRLLAEVESLSDELARIQRDAGAQAERQRIARDIHDTLAQGFSSILLLARAGAERPTPELLHQIETTAADNLAEARRVVHALAPADLAAAPLPAALQRVLDRVASATGASARLAVEGDVRPVPMAVEVALLRLAQGALANVREHARARHVVVTLSYGPDVVSLDVVDDGVGFDPARATSREGRGFGLRAMRERLAELGGAVTVESSPGDGTAVAATVPLGAS